MDSSGADQLIGRGDMLYTQGNDLVRIQCAFVDTPEVERLTRIYWRHKKRMQVPIFYQNTLAKNLAQVLILISMTEINCFREAAEVIVTAQQGSASLLQRKLKLRL